MREGRVVQDSVPATLFNRPRDAWVADFLGFENVIRATVVRSLSPTRHVVAFTGGDAQIVVTTDYQFDVGAEIFVGVRAPQVILHELDEGDTPESGVLTGRVGDAEFLGDHWLVTAMVDHGKVVVTSTRSPSLAPLVRGDRVGIRIDETSARGLPAGV
jgi:ABC-type Fe3+/spermidine/putrescine transport system ATPase subunit